MFTRQGRPRRDAATKAVGRRQMFTFVGVSAAGAAVATVADARSASASATTMYVDATNFGTGTTYLQSSASTEPTMEINSTAGNSNWYTAAVLTEGTGYGVFGRGNLGGVVGLASSNGPKSTSIPAAGVVGLGQDAQGSDTPGVVGVAGSKDAVSGTSGSGAGVFGQTTSGAAGVHGNSVGSSGVGVMGDGAYDGAGVYGHSGSNPGVRGIANEGIGVYGLALSAGGIGVQGVSATSHGVCAQVGNPTTNPATLAAAAVLAQAGGAQPAVYALAASGTGALATSSSGYGVVASGGKAPLRLVPATTAGHPTSGKHLVGEFWVDKNGALYFCTGTGTPGTWKQVNLT